MLKLKWLDSRPAGRPPNEGEVWPEAAYVDPKHASAYDNRLSVEYRTSAKSTRAPLVMRYQGQDVVLDFIRGLTLEGEKANLTAKQRGLEDGRLVIPGKFSGQLKDGELLTDGELARASERSQRTEEEVAQEDTNPGIRTQRHG